MASSPRRSIRLRDPTVVLPRSSSLWKHLPAHLTGTKRKQEMEEPSKRTVYAVIEEADTLGGGRRQDLQCVCLTREQAEEAVCFRLRMKLSNVMAIQYKGKNPHAPSADAPYAEHLKASDILLSMEGLEELRARLPRTIPQDQFSPWIFIKAFEVFGSDGKDVSQQLTNIGGVWSVVLHEGRTGGIRIADFFTTESQAERECICFLYHYLRWGTFEFSQQVYRTSEPREKVAEIAIGQLSSDQMKKILLPLGICAKPEFCAMETGPKRRAL